ncbi:FadR/GntR family transcriptional regulator [Paraburkholderia tropica]|uniref:FadR/GntR family transcriptional regulator n=1 Tax=Paraburkholderia tropica TaxID=92647 RepID=UPI002AB6D83B|nr:FadR/GntR family transcriptional regulator [Paraburkholderia tropica]
MFKVQPLPKTRAEQVVDAIGRDIVTGRLAPGAPLPGEEALLAQYGVSRTVLREALQVLAAKGMVESRQKRGTHVTLPEKWHQLDPAVLSWHSQLSANAPVLLDLMEVRRIVEPAAAALAASRFSDEDKRRLAAAYDEMAKAAQSGDTEGFIAADLEFHSAILLATHNRFLAPLAHAIRATMLASLHLTNSRAEENLSISLPLHRKVLDAILEENADLARNSMLEHLTDTEARRQRSARNQLPL